MTVYQDQYHMADFTYDDYEKIVITQKGPIYICAFNDAGNLNAMSYQQMAEFNDFLIKVRMDPDCRVIVLTGEGSSFCAGFNLNDLALDPPEEMGRTQRDFFIMQTICGEHARLSAADHRSAEGSCSWRWSFYILCLRPARFR